MIRLLPTLPPPYLVNKPDWRHTERMRKRENLLTGEGEGGGEEPNQTTARKPDPLHTKHHPILSDITEPIPRKLSTRQVSFCLYWCTVQYVVI
jgi:hypothetical protein